MGKLSRTDVFVLIPVLLAVKKRLRKKLYLKEYRQVGFRFLFDFIEPTSEAEEWQFVVDLMAYEDANAISAGGGHANFYVYDASRRGSITPQQRQSLIDWLKQRTDITNVEVRPLTDAWYPLKKRGQVPVNAGDTSVFLSPTSMHA
ncbi:MAG: DUF469 family protein [Hymenobacter sp.]|nr:MAG: DUF469 family protein [Hymenobacter sp.]